MELLLRMHLVCHYGISHYVQSRELHLEPVQELLPMPFSTQANLQMFLPVKSSKSFYLAFEGVLKGIKLHLLE